MYDSPFKHLYGYSYFCKFLSPLIFYHYLSLIFIHSYITLNLSEMVNNIFVILFSDLIVFQVGRHITYPPPTHGKNLMCVLTVVIIVIVILCIVVYYVFVNLHLSYLL